MFILSDPYVAGGNHLPDWVIARPIFVGPDGAKRLAGFCCNRAHQSDIGGGLAGTYNPEATEIWHEGIRLPVMKLVDRGEVRLLTEMTPEAFRVLRERDRGFADLFHIIPVSEPSPTDTLRVLMQTQRQLEERHDCSFEVDALPLLMHGDAAVTSTRVRGLLAEGRVAEVAELLGEPYLLAGHVVGGERVGRTLGFPTANLQLHDEQLVPANGIYAVRVRIAGEHVWRMGAMSIGVRPTFGGTVRTLEVHLLDWDGDLYGRNLTVAMIDWLRGEERFDGVEPLIAQMTADCAEARVRLAAAPWLVG